MDWHSETRDQALVATPKGTINHETADAFEEHLIPALDEAGKNNSALVINLEHVDYISSAGLRILMRISKRAREASVDIRVANLNDCTREIFQISRFDKLIPVFDSLDAAVAG